MKLELPETHVHAPYANPPVNVALPPGCCTTTSTWPAVPADVVTVIVVALATLNAVPAPLPNVTPVASVKPVPVIVTAVGGLHEVVEAGKNGLIVPTRNVGQLAEAIKHLLNLPANQLLEMGQYSKTLAQTKYSWHVIAQQTEAVYHSRKTNPCRCVAP